MAVDPKTGKPVATPSDVGRAFAEDLVRTGRITRAQAGAVAEDLARAAAADAEPRGVSVLRGAYGPWLAAQEVLREGRP
jgi:S1-C subfamily serine protease